jgi:hypothetical protein
MAAVLLARAKEVRDDGSMVEIVIWALPEPLPPSKHRYKYRLYYGAAGISRVRYDNERGKGDHRHIGSQSTSTRSAPWINCSRTSGPMSSAGSSYEGHH